MIGYILFQSYIYVMMKLVLLFFICHYSASVENDPVCGESFCSQIMLLAPPFYFEGHVTTVGKLGSMICPSQELDLSLFECDLNKCHCNMSLLIYNNCFLIKKDFCDKFVNCTDCKSFAKKCEYELHGYCPNQYPIPGSPRVAATTSKPNAGLAVFLISFLCVIVATISVYVYKQRRRQMRQLQTQTQRKGFMEKLTTYSYNKTREN